MRSCPKGPFFNELTPEGGGKRGQWSADVSFEKHNGLSIFRSKNFIKTKFGYILIEIWHCPSLNQPDAKGITKLQRTIFSH